MSGGRRFGRRGAAAEARAGYDVQGLYMSNWEDDDSYCTGAQDFQDARALRRRTTDPVAPA